jgi:hypothetical protein
MSQTLFLNKHSLTHDDIPFIHAAGTVQSLFEEHEGEVEHLPWPEQSPVLNITETFWSV